MTRDNLRKRQIIKPLECVFCSEAETCSHLFFDCVVSRQIWPLVSNHFGVDTGTDFESVARLWIANKKHSALNTTNVVVLWCIWKYRNSMIFNNTMWTSIKQVMRLILKTIKNWVILSSDGAAERLEAFTTHLATNLRQPLMIGG